MMRQRAATVPDPHRGASGTSRPDLVPIVSDVRVVGPLVASASDILIPDAVAFVAALHRQFDGRRRSVLALRPARRARIASVPPGVAVEYRSDTQHLRTGAWRVAEAPADLNDRRTEITGPAERKMMINALNSGAKVFMADLEDSCSPTWENVVQGQRCLYEAVRGTLALDTAEKSYRLNATRATLVVRPRGWHMQERHLLIDGEPASASLVDFGLYFFHNARELLARDSGPYFYLPKMEGHEEARLWNDVFVAAQEQLQVPVGSIRATVLIETLPAAFEMEEILHELREHAAGLNAGRWDYLFSFIKTFRDRAEKVLPDRAQLTMSVPFMRAYAQRLVRVCHRRGAHAIGGMAAFIPNRRDPAVNAVALAKVREDKERESAMGFDGTWVAHPDLVPVALKAFDAVLGANPHQKDRGAAGADIEASRLIDAQIPGGAVTAEGVRMNVEVALLYLEAWLRGVGAVAIHNLMEDAATAEISRTQLWQWIRHGAVIDAGGAMTREYYLAVRTAELGRLKAEAPREHRLDEAAALLDILVLEDFEEFLTLSGAGLLD